MRDEYVTGNESYLQLARRYGVNLKTVEKHALNRKLPVNGGRTWGEWRLDFRRKTSEEVETKTTAIASRTLAEVREKSVTISKLALAELERRLTRPEDNPDAAILIETRDLIQAAKLSATIKIELSGNPDVDTPIPIEHKLDQLTTDELRKLAGGP